MNGPAFVAGGLLVLMGVVVGAVIADPSIPLTDLAVTGGVAAVVLAVLAIGRWPRP